jgi:ABC-type antimicrobial peptide transport system permease subunit
MLRNYFITALRNFWRHKIFSVINVLGLSIGISAALVIFLVVYYEFSFDKVNDQERIYRVVIDAKFNGTEGHSAGVPAPLGPAVAAELTGVEQTVPVMQFQGDSKATVTVTTSAGAKQVFKTQEGVVFTNQQYFKLLSFEWLAGSPLEALHDPFSLVLTGKRAAYYFPGVAPADLIGRQMVYNEIPLTVTGIVKEPTRQSSFTGDQFISYSTISQTHLKEPFMMNVWDDWMAYSQLLVKISEGYTKATIETQLAGLLEKYNKNANKDAANFMAFHLQPLADLHFNNQYQGVGQRIANRSTLYGLLAIGGFILLLGFINFINLTTAQSSQRSREIGIRKTMGSSKRQLVAQFLGETLFITIIATILSIALTPLLLHVFADFIPPGLRFDVLNQPSLVIFLVGLILVVSFLSGLYPALVLSGYNPVLVLKNQASTHSSQTRNTWVRKTLTVSQFVIAQVFIIATVMVGRQINFSLSADMGFAKEAIINVDLPRDTVRSHAAQLLNLVKNMPGVATASSGFFAPADQGVAFANLAYDNGSEVLTPNTQIRWGDAAFVPLFEIKLAAGRNVFPSDTIREFLVNESYAHTVGFKNAGEIVGKQLSWNGKNIPVVGVMKDFHDQSMKALISPVVFGGATGNTLHIKLAANSADGTKWKTTLAGIQHTFKKMYPEEDFNFRFLDETIANFYKAEQNTSRLLKWSTGITVFISCLGLLGLAIYTTNTRRKEIGIRKVLGASVARITFLLSKDFVKLVALAILIASPIAAWVMHNWLQDYAYKVNLSAWVFIGTGAVAILLALLTVSLRSIQAAVANPVESLRTE